MKLPKSKMRTRGIPKVVRHLALMLGVALAATPASADPVLDMVGAAITPMPFSAKIVSTGTDAVYFNPTLMLDQKPGFRIGFFYMRHNLNIGYMDRPADDDISLDAYSSRPIDETPLPSDRMRPTPTSALVNKRGAHNPIDNTYYMNISHSAHFIKDKLARRLYADSHQQLPVAAAILRGRKGTNLFELAALRALRRQDAQLPVFDVDCGTAGQVGVAWESG